MLFGWNKKDTASEGAITLEQRLLGMGAILIYANQSNGWKPTTLEINAKKATPQMVLSEFWAAKSKEDVLESVEALLYVGGKGLMGGAQSRTREQIDSSLKNGTLSSAEYEMLGKMMNLLKGYKFNKVKLTQEDLDNVRTTLAWDLERAAFLVRLAFNCQWFSRDETFDMLRKIRGLAENDFSSWRDYAISFIKGRSIVMCSSNYSDMTDIWANAVLLMDPKWGVVWSWAPLRQ